MLAPIIKAVYLLDSSSRHKFPEHTDLNSQVSSHLLGCLFYV
ncbi:conserved hypothetical protein [Vibrio chagasii]|nr:conserved hypothetical protein [Vibrio chagasii]CAH6964253.1 conserved hypothetical protein [Vibrio chagasii]CAH7001378.1 conserved hypothetical protein [Vibrio chagasii]CAH7080885.1 conserved hypothetical protein [Vibrio chagasii]CAH7102314.1 conserved hypothetical protein [Vibrio chagasii]